WSPGPGTGTVAYTNGVDTCVYSGDEMPVAGFGTFTDITTTSSAISFTASTNSAGACALNFSTLGFRPGQQVAVSGTTNNNRIYTIKQLQADCGTYDQLVFAEDVTQNDAAGSAVTITASPAYNGYTHYVDYSEAVNNTLTTEGNIVPIGGGIDSYAEMMLHCDGVDGSTTITDSATVPHTVTATNGADITATTMRFGTGSAYFDGTDDYLTTPDSNDWAFGTGNFTIDFWMKLTSLPGYGTAIRGVFEQHFDGSRFIDCWLGHKEIFFHAWDSLLGAGGSGVYAYATVDTNSWLLNRWYHIAIVRGWGGDNTKVVVTVDGKPGLVKTFTGTSMPNLSANFEIGRVNGGAGYYYLGGMIDEFRVSKGVARWTQDFGPPSSPYRPTNDNDWMILSRRPLEGVKYYVNAVNSDTSTMTGRVWNGSGFTTLTLTDGTASGGTSLAQTGTASFASTAGEAQPLSFEGTYFYAYWFTLSAGGADVYHVTLDAPFQQVNDLWDGIYRRCVNFQVATADGQGYSDFTLEVNEASYAGDIIGANLKSLATNQHVIFIFQDRMAGVFFSIPAGETNTAVSVPKIEYNSAAGWTDVGSLTDGTVSDLYRWEPLGQSGLLAWTPPKAAQEIPATMFGVNGWAYRMSFSAALASTSMIDTITGIPAQKKLGAYTLPAIYKERLMLCGGIGDKQLNRVDYSSPNSCEVWNGTNSSNDGLQSLYFGGGEPITCATQLYNRFGAEVYAFFLVLKDNETYLLTGDTPEEFKIFPISKNVGCPAPSTLAATETGYEMAEDMQRQVALWVSASGPILFDGAVLQPIKGLETYFDPSSANYLTMASIANARGWYDSAHGEYNIVFPVNEKWFVYNLAKKKWFMKSAPIYPDCAWPAVDAQGVQYIYAGIDGGYMKRLENGTTWDGTGITQTLQTGDFFPSKSMWDQTVIRRFKFLFKDTAESASCAITHYPNTETSGTSLTAVNLNSGTGRIGNSNQEANLVGWAHSFKWAVTTSSTNKGMEPIGWACKYKHYREDR
ncbi:MAG: LamG domain-containing protein, partial [Pseudomonadota bacterium]